MVSTLALYISINYMKGHVNRKPSGLLVSAQELQQGHPYIRISKSTHGWVAQIFRTHHIAGTVRIWAGDLHKWESPSYHGHLWETLGGQPWSPSTRPSGEPPFLALLRHLQVAQQNWSGPTWQACNLQEAFSTDVKAQEMMPSDGKRCS